MLGSAVLSERWPLCTAVWEKFLSGCLPLPGSGRERGWGSELAPRSAELSLGRGSVEAFGSMGGQSVFGNSEGVEVVSLWGSIWPGQGILHKLIPLSLGGLLEFAIQSG